MCESICPICQLPVPTFELEGHANSHFEDEDFARDRDLALQIAFAPPCPPLVLNNEVKSGVLETSAPNGCNGWRSYDEESDIDVKVYDVICSQVKESFHRVEAGLVPLLRRCLEFDYENSISILSGYVDHFHSIKSEDLGWGCGWRNIQMLCSHLLVHRKDARDNLFGGCGYVPDIISLQRWLEIAWERGFDKIGSTHFGHRICGKKNWIGTTECATLFRSFGLRAKIVDFDSEGVHKRYLAPGSRHGSLEIRVSGPMDRYLSRGLNTRQEDPNLEEKYSNPSLVLGNDTGSSAVTRSVKGQQVLIDWVWNYFSDKKIINLGSARVMVSEKAPLYFQHDGHSRMIVGIQLAHQNGKKQYNLLVLDPAHKTVDLERALNENAGWQKQIKRGVHTLKEPQYQLCYIDSGIVHGDENERLKMLDSVYIEF